MSDVSEKGRAWIKNRTPNNKWDEGYERVYGKKEKPAYTYKARVRVIKSIAMKWESPIKLSTKECIDEALRLSKDEFGFVVTEESRAVMDCDYYHNKERR